MPHVSFQHVKLTWAKVASKLCKSWSVCQWNHFWQHILDPWGARSSPNLRPLPLCSAR